MKVSVTYIEKDGRSRKLEVENDSPELIAEQFEALGIDVSAIAVNGEKYDGTVDDGDVVTEQQTAKGG